MHSVYDLYRRLCDLPGVTPHSQIAAHPKDIDLYVPISCMPTARGILENDGYTCIKSSDPHSVFCKYIGGELFVFDICCDYNYYFNHFPAIELSKYANSLLGSDPKLNKIIKRFSKQSFLADSDVATLGRFFRDAENFIKCPGNRSSADGDVLLLRKLMSKYSRLFLFFHRAKIIFQSINTGKSFAFIGPDGSGKGFFISRLQKVDSVKVIYMGDWFFMMQSLYTFLLNFPSPYNRFLYVFYYFENLVRRMRVAFWTFVGKTVFIDRFPGTNTPIIHSGFAGFINHLIFKLTPKPDMFVLLYAHPMVVFERKQELGVCQIHRIQVRQQELLASYPHILIHTEHLDDSLNCLLSKCYGKTLSLV